MKFRTELSVLPSPFSINHYTGVCLLGSCFSNNIGNKLKRLKFSVVINPHGIVYNPVSILNTIRSASQESSGLDTDSIVERDGLFLSLQHHSSLYAHSEPELEKNITASNLELAKALSTSRAVFITLGTAWVYELVSSGKVVANCQKLPAKHFSKRLLKFEEIVEQLESINQVLRGMNSSVQVIYTLSPVRHIKDGIEENSVSKALLRAAISTICNKEESAHYFPSYELMMDDLRDYRFYTDDMLHPNEMAIDYIWQKFSGAFFDEATLSLNKDINKVVTSSLHRPLMASKKVNAFARKNLAKIKGLENQLDSLDFSSEKSRFRQMLT